jgi:hypothetical protein
VAGNGSAFNNPNAPQGTQVAFLQKTGSVTQSLNFFAGTYKISFSAVQRPGNSQTIKVLVDGTSVGTFTPSGSSFATFTTNAFTVTAGSHTITFAGTVSSGDNTAFIDQISVAATSLSGFSDAGFEEPVVGTGFKYNPAGMGGTHELFKDGIALTTASGTQELHLDLTAAASPLKSDKLLGVGGISLRSLAPAVNATGQSTANTTAEGGGVLENAFPSSNLTTTPTVKAWAAPALATVEGNVTIASESLTNNLASAYLAGGGLINIQTAQATTNFGTTGGTAAVNEAFVGVEDSSGKVSGNGVNIKAAQGFTLSSLTSLATDPSATAHGGGLGAGVSAYATANVNNATNTTVGGAAVVSGQTVNILADVQNLGITAPTEGKAYGLISIPHAESSINVASTAKVLIGGGTTRITGQGPVDIQARHDTFKPILSPYAAWNDIETPHEEHANYNNPSLHSKIEADAGATVAAGPPAGSTTALSVLADQGASISHTTPDPTIVWDANVIVAAGASPYLLVDSNGNIVKAVGVTVDDSAARGSNYSAITSGQIQSSTVVVNTVNNPGSQVVFTANNGVTNGTAYSFDAKSAVDATSHYITLGSTPVKTGDALVYNNGGGTSIGLSGGGTLTSGATYYAVVDSSHPNQVRLASTLDNARAGTALQLLPLSTSSTQSLKLFPMFTFTDTLQGVTIINHSAKTLQIGNIDVANRSSSSAPNVLINNSSNTGNFEFDIQHTVAPSFIDIEQDSSTAEDINLTGDIENPIGTTTIKDANGYVKNTVGSTQIIRTNILDVEASNSLGSSSNSLNADLVQSTDTSTGGTRTPQLTARATNGNMYLNLRGRNRTTSASTLTIYAPAVSAGGDINLQLQSSVVDSGTGGTTGKVHVVDQADSSLTGDYAAHFHDAIRTANATLDQGVYASATNNTTTSSTYDFRNRNQSGALTGLADLSAGGNISIQSANHASTDPTIDIVGTTNLQSATTTATNHIDVTTNGKIDLSQVGGTMRIGTIQSTNSDVTLSVPETSAQVENLEMPGTSSVTAWGNVLMQVGANVNLMAGSTITAQGGNATTPNGTVTIQCDYENGATIDPDSGTTINLFGGIYGTSAKVYGYDDGDTFNIEQVVSTTPMTVTANGKNNTFNVGSTAPTTGGIVDNIQGALTIVGDAGGTATLNVDDTGSTGAKTDGTLTSTALTGLNMGSSGITYSNLGNLNINLGSGGNTFLIQSTAATTTTSLNSGTGADTVNVQTTAGPTTVNTGSGSNANTVNVGSTAPTAGGIVDNIQGTLSVVGNTYDTLNVDDTGSTGPKSGTLTPTSLTGLGMGRAGINYSGLATLNVKLGSGGSTLSSGPVGNTFTINDITPATTTNVDGGRSNNDTANYTAAQDFNATLNLTAFEHGTVNVTRDFNGTLNDTQPGHLESVQIGRSLTTTGVLNAGSIDTMTVGKDLAGTVNVLGALTTLKVTGDVSGSVTETGTVNLLSIGGSLTSTGVIKAVNSADSATPTSTQGLLGNINTMTVGGAVAGTVQVSGNLGSLTVGTANTPTTAGVNDVSGSVTVGGQLTTASVSGNVSGSITEALTTDSLYIGGSLTSTGLIKAVNSKTASLGNINTLTVGQDLAGTVIVSGTLANLNIVNGSITPTGSVTAANLNSLVIGPNKVSVGQNMAGTINVSGNLGSVQVAGGTPGWFKAGHIGTIAVYGGYGPVVLRVTENGIERRIEEAVPSTPYPQPDPTTLATTATNSKYVNIQYFYESATPVISGNQLTLTNALDNPQLTARITNNVSTARDQYDLSLVTYSDTAMFNLARLDASGIAGVRNVDVEGDVLTAVSSQASAFFPGNNTAAGIRLPQDNLAGVGVRDYVPNASIQAASIQAVAFGSHTSTTSGKIITGASSQGADAQALLVSGTKMAYSNDTFRVPFADLPSQQSQLFLVTSPTGGSFNNNGILFTLQSTSTPNAAGTANIVTPNNVARGAVTALVKVVAAYDSKGNLVSPLVQSIDLRGDGGSLLTVQPFSATGSISSTGPLGDVTLHESPGLYNLTAPSVFGSITIDGPITGVAQTTGQRTDPITSVVTTVNADLGHLYVDTSGKSPVVTSTTVTTGGLSGQLVSRGDLVSQVTLNGGPLTGAVAVQGNLGKIFTPSSGPAMRQGGILVNNAYGGEVVVLGSAYGDMRFNGGLKGGRLAVKGGIVGNLTDNGTDATAAIVSGGEIGDATWGTQFTFSGSNKGIVVAKGKMTFAKGSPGGTVFNNATGTNAAAIDAIFTNGGSPLSFDLNPLDLGGLQLILTDLAALYVDSNGNLAGPKK